MSARAEAHIMQKGREMIIPSTRGLFKTVEGHFELADKMWIVGINIAESLLIGNAILLMITLRN